MQNPLRYQFVRALLVRALPVVIGATAFGCSSADAPPVAENSAAATAADAGPSFASSSDAAVMALPPLDPGSDAGTTVVLDAAAPLPAVDAGPVPCPVGGELEVEPNDVTPNELNNIRCGVLAGADAKDLLQISRAAFGLAWTGAVNVTLTQPVVGGPYVAEITSKTPGVPVYWVLNFK